VKKLLFFLISSFSFASDNATFSKELLKTIPFGDFLSNFIQTPIGSLIFAIGGGIGLTFFILFILSGKEKEDDFILGAIIGFFLGSRRKD
jgi:hypothetical protein